MRLSQTTLDALPIPYPAYDRPVVRAGIVHLGVGGFHRAHQAVYIDRLLTRGKTGWGITGIGVMPGDSAMRDALASQDHLYTLSVRNPDGSVSDQVIGSIIDYVLAPEDPEAAIEALANPIVRIVSLTITEGGYFANGATGEFDADHPAIRTDLASPERPATAFGLIVAALGRRRARGHGPVTVMSCDNIQHNGTLARRAVLGYAQALDATGSTTGLADWIEKHVTFPNSMVDRITPVTTEADRSALVDRTGIEDAWPVVCEPFIHWVLEDSFAAGRPPLEDVGVQVVADVTPYEHLKLRLLNAAHQAIAHPGALLGYEFIDQALGHPVVADLVRAYHREAIGSLAEAPGIDPAEYGATVIERFSNAGIRDTVARIRVDGSDRIALFLLPVVRDNLAARRPVTVSALIVALWATGVAADVAGAASGTGRPADRRADLLAAAIPRFEVDPASFLDLSEIFGDLGADPVFRAAFTSAVEALRGPGGVAAGIQAVLR